MGNRCLKRLIGSGWRFAPVAALLLSASASLAQGNGPRMRGPSRQGVSTPPAVVPQPQPQTAPLPVSQPLSLLQQPAQPAQVTLRAAQLSIHADNASLSAILHEISNISGMKIEGLGGDERVFGTFGPGSPRDVIADLLNGTSYNVVLLGDLTNGAPRELILTPASHGGAAAPIPAVQAGNEEPEQEAPEPPQPEPPPQQQPEQQVNPQQPPGSVRTPQQLFEQLQRMRQNQGQQPPDQPQQ